MRDRLTLLVPLSCLALATVGCSDADAARQGPAVSRAFPAAGFDTIDLRGADDAVVRVGPAFSVVATGPRKLIDRLLVEVRSGTLRIARQNDWSWSDQGHAVLTITLPALAAATVSGSGDMTIAPFRAPHFAGAVAGSGNLTLARVEADQTSFSVAGSGNLKVSGHSGSARYSVAGSGNIAAADLTATTISASTSGSGNIDARALGTANTAVIGSGDIVVHGPARCAISKLGSGTVTCG